MKLLSRSLLLFSALCLFWRYDDAYEAAFLNSIRLRFLATAICPADFATSTQTAICSHLPTQQAANEVELNRVDDLLQGAQWLGLRPRVEIQRAEAAFSLGDRQRALRLLRPDLITLPGQSPLTTPTRYEYHVLRAWAEATTADWTQAVHEFQLALIAGNGLLLPQDYDVYAQALVGRGDQDNASDPRQGLLDGAFLVTGGSKQALPVLKKWLQTGSALPLIPADLAWGYYYLGEAYLQGGETLQAVEAYQMALAQDPGQRLALARLLRLSFSIHQEPQDGSQSTLAAQLSQLGPGTLIGMQTQGVRQPAPAILPGGWSLAGYDLDPRMIADFPRLTALLWWRAPAGWQPPDAAAWVQAGAYWLQWQDLTNLFLNAGFEWGEQEDLHLPLGVQRELYGDPDAQWDIQVVMDQNQRPTTALITNNQPNTPRIGFASQMHPVGPGEYYLIAGSMVDGEQGADIGINCQGSGFPVKRPFYLFEATHHASEQWFFASRLVDDTWLNGAEECELILVNYDSTASALWDNILWAKIELP